MWITACHFPIFSPFARFNERYIYHPLILGGFFFSKKKVGI